MQHCCWAIVGTSPAWTAGIGASVIVSKEGSYRVQSTFDTELSNKLIVHTCVRVGAFVLMYFRGDAEIASYSITCH